jgi:hypothetical protein
MMFLLAPGCSSRFPVILGVEVDDARGGSWTRYFIVWLYLAAKPSHVGVDVDMLACPCTVLGPAAVRQGDRASCHALSCPIIAVGGGTFLANVKPPGLDIWWRVDCMGTCATESLMEKPGTGSPRAQLPGARACRYPRYKTLIDPLSPILFNIVFDMLAIIINRAKSEGQITRVILNSTAYLSCNT